MGFRHTLIALFAAIAALAIPAAASAATPALVFSKVTTQTHGSETIESGGLYAARGQHVSQLTDDPADAEPAFSPDGDTIAFVRDGDLYTTRPDGTGERALTSGTELDSSPQFSVDGRTIVFERATGPGAPRGLYAIGVRGGGLRALAPASADEHEATLSRNGKAIAFVRSSAGRDAIYSVRLDGGGLTRLSRGNEDAFAPHYFAGGIVFDRGESSEGPSGYSDIYAMAADGAKPHKLVGGASSVYLQDVSADGRTMLFSRYESLCEKAIAGGAPHKIGALPTGVESQARFSPSGRQVAVRTESYESSSSSASSSSAQRLYTLDVRRGFELGELAQAEEGEGPSADIGDGFAWQPVAHGAY